MTPLQLIGMNYRLGADPVRHGATDCIGLVVTVLNHYGIQTPVIQRDWYRRLRRGDTQVFEDELNRWGKKTTKPTIGVVALCPANMGKGLAVFAEGGWLLFSGSTVQWRPIDALQDVVFYCQRNST